jgi:predicted MPP superfamily phosphohydrolase
MHDGQIALPYPGGKLRFAHLSARFPCGVYRTRAGVMHVSPGLGTTFVPFRFAARPEATELVLRSAAR